MACFLSKVRHPSPAGAEAPATVHDRTVLALTNGKRCAMCTLATAAVAIGAKGL